MLEHIFLLNLIGCTSYIFFSNLNKPLHLLVDISIVNWTEKSLALGN